MRAMRGVLGLVASLCLLAFSSETRGQSWTNEPMPNGGRVNVGLYGGTAEASKSRTNEWLFAMSFNDGGTLIGTSRVEWVGGNLGTNATVNLQYTTNNGVSWESIATGVTATNESYTWAPDFDYPAVLWRVVHTNSGVASTNAKVFSVRRSTNVVFNFYVNDNSTDNDVYCSALGSSTNDGAASSRPLRSLQSVVNRYQLRGGDTVYVDTGDYATNVTITIGGFDSGVAGKPVKIIGSPKGSVFNRGNIGANVLDLAGASYLEIENLKLTGGAAGLNGGVSNIVLRGMQFIGNTYGVIINGAAHTFENCVAADNTQRAFNGSGSGSNVWRNGVMWGSPTLVFAPTNATLSVSNSILGNGTTLFGSQIIPGDFNLVWNVGVGLSYQAFTDFQNAGYWTNSLYADPVFANAAGGDFHLKSVMGRYNPATGLFETNDAVHSPGIDLGDPSAIYTNEPVPNGSRLNVGLHGNTAQASKSRTNAWLQIRSYTDGGTLDAQAGSWLRWNGANFDPSATVTLWLSRDNGVSWETLATNQMATNGAYFYQNTSSNDYSALYAMWKVTLDNATPSVSSQSPTNFNYRNGAYAFYVNDASTNGDVYCTAPGSDSNLGVSPGAPMQSLHTLINTYKIGPGDRVYIDTGVYTATNTVLITAQDSGGATNPVFIIGSTNRLAGGSLFRSPAIPQRPLAFNISGAASNIILRDIVVSNASRGVMVSNALNIRLEGVEVRGAGQTAFELANNARSVTVTRCVAHGGGIGISLQQATNIVVNHSLFWQNTNNAVYLGTQVGLLLENSILASTNFGAALYSVPSNSPTVTMDYNGIHAGPNTRVGINRTTGARADSLVAWQYLANDQDVHSIANNPLMADPDAFDYHLLTEQALGRIMPNGQRTTDPVSSPLLDAGNPASDFSAEPAPNGGRVNIGVFGGSAQASSARVSPWLKAISFGDAGYVTNGTFTLRWIAGGELSNETVKVEVSVDGGRSWTQTVASGVAATNGEATWNVADLPDTPAGVWRVTGLQRTNVWSGSSNFFAIRNQPLNLYVNGIYTNEAVYTTAAGRPDNWMATSNAPLDSLRVVFERFDLEPGDSIWVDPAVYLEPAAISISLKNSGTTSQPIRVTGPLNKPYTGAILARTSRGSGSYVIQLVNARGIEFSGLVVSNAFIGIYEQNSQGILWNKGRVSHCVTNGIFAGSGADLTVSHSIIENNLTAGLQTLTGSTIRVHNSLLRNNDYAAILRKGGDLDVKNSIILASGDRRYVYWGGGGTLSSDYNNIRATDGAFVSGNEDRLPDRFLIDWQIRTSFSNDSRSLGYEPLFANAGTYDFHLLSEYGRYNPINGSWTNDTSTSRLIDMGAPAFAFTNEPSPNGSRINIGLHGNTGEASKSPGGGALVPITVSDGGTLRGTVNLYWSWNGVSNNAPVNVQFSADGGATWSNIATNVYADMGGTGLPWATTNYLSTAQGVWRVCTTNSSVCGQTETLFAIKNDPVAYYVNDNSTVGDVYCTGPGRATNSGLSAAAPLNSLATLLSRYKVEHGDTVYVDTGVYPRTAPLTIAISAIAPTNRLIIQGSTNEAAGGTVFTNASGTILEILNSSNIELRDIRLHGGSQGLVLNRSSSNRFVGVRSMNAAVNAFVISVQSGENEFIRCAALNFSQTGFYMAPIMSQQIAPVTNFWSQGVLSPLPASNGIALTTGTLIGVESGCLYVSNSALIANSPAHEIFRLGAGTVAGDYNLFHQPHANTIFAKTPRGGSVFGVQTIQFRDLTEWQEWTQGQSNSFMADPLFANLVTGNLYPRSQAGRYDPTTQDYVLDAETSPLIDSADPALPWAAEGEPNGSRANIGIYGGTPAASRSPTNGSFVLLTLNQGGTASGTQRLRWIARGAVTNPSHRVNVQLSTNSGASWQNIGVSTGLVGFHEWDTTSLPPLTACRWRVQSQSQSTWVTASERDFMVRNAPWTFYVNDAATNGDIYTTAIGAITNSGLHPSSPLPSLAAVLTTYDVRPGDLILIDTGIYTNSTPVIIGYMDRGEIAEPVVIRGSTNAAGSVFTQNGLNLVNTRGLKLEHLRFENMMAGAAMVSASEDISLQNVDILGNVGSGITISQSSNILVRNFAVTGAQTNGVVCEASYGTTLEFGVVWSNVSAQVVVNNQLQQGGANSAYNDAYTTISNCIIGSFGIRVPAYLLNGTLVSDYNNIYLGNGGLAALSYTGGFAREYDSVGSWVGTNGFYDSHSLSHSPLFVDAAAGDFHLMSSAGRWVPAANQWTNDAVTSPLIDAGTPSLACTEPEPNGARVNIGRYGNTAQASKTPTNSALTLITFNDGGRASGNNVPIQWNARGQITNGTISIYYSADGGGTWSLLTNGLAANSGVWNWDSTASEQSVQAKLKIEGSDGSSTQSDKVFSVRNAPFYFYVNDGSTIGDVYCTAIGQGANSGLSSNAPMADLNALLAKYDLESGDVVYIDTGVYATGVDPWRITQADSAGALNVPPVVFQGSTSSLMGGTVLQRNYNSVGLQADYVIGVVLRNIVVSNTTRTAFALNQARDVALEWCAVGGGDVGVRLNSGNNLRVEHCVVVDANTGVVVDNWDRSTNTVFPVINNNVLWNLGQSAIKISELHRATVMNNIMNITGENYIYDLADTANLVADYNALWLGTHGRVARRMQGGDRSRYPLVYETVGAWATSSSNDLHSYDGDPLLVNPSNRIFHLKSRAGRWNPIAGSWTNDAQTSPLIDMGEPSAKTWTNEPAPNGQRLNVGLYGGTSLASKSETNSALCLLTLNHGGVVTGPVALNWLATGMATGHTVRVEVSNDDGETWHLVVPSVSATLGGVKWNSSSLASSPLGRWKVTDLDEPMVTAISARPFVIHHSAITYYVNDDHADGDVYCTELGNSTNTGISPDSPKRWVAEIIDSYNLEPGDTIYVDTGTYSMSQPTVFGDLDAGDFIQAADRQVNVIGSTNALAGGSLFVMTDPTVNAFELKNTYGIRLAHLGILNASNGIYAQDSRMIAVEWLEMRNCANGISSVDSSSMQVRHSTFVGNQNAGVYVAAVEMGTVDIQSSVFWGNRAGCYLAQGYAHVSNSIVGITRPNSYGIYWHADKPLTGYSGDYNNLFVGHPNAAIGALQTGASSSARTNVYAFLSKWAADLGADTHSLAQDPLLAEPGYDFHLKSAGGRYQPGTGWVTDPVSSPMIDAGDPRSLGWTVEPLPNGTRVNIGLYGGTTEASKTPSNGILTCVFPTEGGQVEKDIVLQWSAIGAATNHSVLLEYSSDAGVTWSNIVSGWPAESGSYKWNSVPYGRSARAWWRITSLDDYSIRDQAGPFMLKNGGMIPFYVNDTNMTGDVYCTAIGDDINDGLTPETPKASLQAIFDSYDLAASDVIYVDAGTYLAGSPPIKINEKDSGHSANGTNYFITVQGSTNPVAPTIFIAPSFSAPQVFALDYAVNIRLKDLTIRNAQTGISAYKTIGLELDGVRVENNRITGLTIDDCEETRMIRSVLWKNASPTGGIAIALNKGDLCVENSVLWGSYSGITVGSGSLQITNSVLYASGPNGRIYNYGISSSIGGGGFRGDYNSYARWNGALIAEQALQVGGSDYFNDLPTWSKRVGSDRHSMTATYSLEPAFADEITGDFHPKSTKGRFIPASQTWTNDAVRSPLIDAGAPDYAADREPEPNGGMINIGAYGNTAQASMSQTNPPWVQAISYNAEGILSGEALLYWTFGGLPDGALVRLDYSPDYEVTWKPIASNVPAATREFLWDLSGLPLSLGMQWRVMYQGNTNIWDVTDVPIPHNPPGTKTFYINDNSTNGDVWCSGPGLPFSAGTPYGTNAAQPLNSLADLLANYPVGPGDIIYVDTGTYPLSKPILINERHQGTTSMPVRIYGSTNISAGGAVFQGVENKLFAIQNTRNIRLQDIRVTQAQHGISINNADNVVLIGMELWDNQTNGLYVSGSANITIQNARIWRNGGSAYASAGSKGGETIINATIYGNRGGGISTDKGLTLVNSIVVTTNASAIFVESAQSASIGGDFNLYFFPPNGVLCSNLSEKIDYKNLSEWQTKNKDTHSVVIDPLFVNPAAGDFHLQSTGGYYSNGTWAISTNTSWAIDAGNPTSSFTNEPAPNGGRINLGAYGGTAQASRSDTNHPALLPITLKDGGVAPYGQPLYWLSRGISPTNLVQIEYSPDGGATWLFVANGIPVGSQPYMWYSADPPSPLALWRIFLMTDTNIIGTTTVPFTFRPTPLIYYVNDTDTTGDIYTTAPGAKTNLGYRADSPRDTIQSILEQYRLVGGDSIRVDTGSYTLTNQVFISPKASGSGTNQVLILGSTNLAAGGTLVQAGINMRAPAFEFYGAHDVRLANIRIKGFTNGVSVAEQSSRCVLESLDIQESFGSGVVLNKSQDITLRRVSIRHGTASAISLAQGKAMIESCVLWSNAASAVSLGSGADLGITNSVVSAFGLASYCYESPTNITIQANYNAYFLTNGAQMASIDGVQYESLPQWVRAKAPIDRYSLHTDPLFADAATGDFHLKSSAGRYQLGVGWVQDPPVNGQPVFSPLIDMGAPTTGWTSEPAPNGTRRNIGLYGNTAEASKSNTNRWLQAITAMSGGILFGDTVLTWGYSSLIPTNTKVQLEYSYDGNWLKIGEATVSDGAFYWQSDLRNVDGTERWTSSPAEYWRIFLLNDTNVWDATDRPFGLRNSPFKYYVNDLSTVNDVYTTAIGSDTNPGYYARAPKLTVNALLEDIDIEPGDMVLIDTGIHYMTDTNRPIIWQVSDGGTTNTPVIVRGSTNPAGSWIVATNRFTAGAFMFMEANHIDIRDLGFVGESVRFLGDSITASNLWVTNGTVTINGENAVFKKLQLDRGNLSFSGSNNRIERMEQRWGQASLVGTNITLLNSVVFTTNNLTTALVVNALGATVSNSTVVATRGTAVGKLGAGTLRLGHNILVAGGSDSNSVLAWHDGGLISDWNNFVARDSAWVGIKEGRWETLGYWQAASGRDANSLAIEPLFQNEAAGDFHLNSKMGRWSPIFKDWDIDPQHSPAIDAGNPQIGTGDEIGPHGYRPNLGAYGRTLEASKSITNFWLTAVTQNDGGVLKGSNVTLRWLAGNASGKTVSLEYYDGSAWHTIATGVNATDESYQWDTTGFPDSFAAYWRVVAEDASGTSDQTDHPFQLRNHTHKFFVNDSSLLGDLYCTAVGSDSNSGLSNSAPKATLQAILDAYDLEGGDTVYVDTGTYASTSDVKVIWSRSGNQTADVVIRGNTNDPYATQLVRLGQTNYPAMGLDVKASRIRLTDFSISGVNRAIGLESNVGVRASGLVLHDVGIGIQALGTRNTDIRNSGFWNAEMGISLSNTRTSILENLTFVNTSLAGIQLGNTEVDTLRNNIFIPAPGSYAYAIGSATSLLAQAILDYNLYDFGDEESGSGFFAGATNDLRRWQLEMNRDFRSAITNADLANLDLGDFHPLSEYGRWTDSGWTTDGITSWAVDHGNPAADYSQEPEDNGQRINIGMYGNTAQASKGSIDIELYARTMNEQPLMVTQEDQVWPWVWSAHLLDTNEMVSVQWSGDCGETWTTLTNVNAYQEYYIWRAGIEYQTAGGRWRVISQSNTNIVDMSDTCFLVRWLPPAYLKVYPSSGRIRFDWQGGVQGRRYVVEYSDDFGQTWVTWDEKYNGPAQINRSNFVIPSGGSQLKYTFEDRTSYLRRTRWYRIMVYEE